MKKTLNNKVRIIGGDWRGTTLNIVSGLKVRPSSDRIRETLFNWLAVHIKGASCLDLCAGSGALGFEALSRGAAKLVSVEKHLPTARQLLNQIRKLNASHCSTVVHADIYTWITKAKDVFDVCFIDPPFNDPRRDEYLMLIDKHKLMRKNALLYWEAPAQEVVRCPSGWKIHKQTKGGNVNATLYTCN